MFPLLPALLLLLLQGPTNLDRGVQQGAWPSPVRSVQQNPARHEMAEQEALVSLLALLGNPELGDQAQLEEALCALLSTPITVQTAPVFGAEQVGKTSIRAAGTSTPRDGFVRAQRTRDGPADIV